MKANVKNIENTDEAVKINIGGNEYELIFSLKAAKEICRKYGGLENFTQILTESENVAEVLNEVAWLITLLANQSVLAHNFKNPDNQKKLLTEEEFEIFVTIAEIPNYKGLILKAASRGMKKQIESEEDNGKKKEQDEK